MMNRVYALVLFLLVPLISLQAQNIVLSGKVTEASDGVTGIPFVNVIVQGTTIGTTTDFDGNYKLEVPSTADTLKFSFVGYLDVLEAISGRTVIDIQMGEDAQTLEEIVVVWYHKKRRTYK